MNFKNKLSLFFLFISAIILLNTFTSAGIPKNSRLENYYNSLPKNDENLNYIHIENSNVLSIIYNGASFSNIPTGVLDADSVHVFLYPKEYLYDENSDTAPVNYFFKITPNISGFIGDDINDTTFVRLSGYLHLNSFAQGNPGNPADSLTDRPFSSAMTFDDYQYIWFQPWLEPDNENQPDTLSSIYTDGSVPYINSWDFGLNTDVTGKNYYQDRGISDILHQYAPENDDYYGFIGQENIVSFMDDFNPEAVNQIDFRLGNNLPKHHPQYLQMQKYIYTSPSEEFENVVFLSYRITNRSNEAWNGMPAQPVTVKGLQFSLFIDPDIGYDTFDDWMYADTENNMIYFYDNDGLEDIPEDLGKRPVYTFGTAAQFLGARKGENDFQTAETERYYSRNSVIRNLTAEGYYSGSENNHFGYMTADEDTTNIMKKWLYYNTYFYPRTSFNGSFQEENYPNGTDIWAAFVSGSKTTAPDNTIRPVDKENWAYPTGNTLNQIIDPEYRLDLEPGEHAVFTYALFGGENFISKENFQVELNEDDPNSIISKAKKLHDKYPFLQEWDTPYEFWSQTGIDDYNPENTPLQNKYNLKLSPNPVSNKNSLTIKFENPKNENIMISVYSITGRKIKEINSELTEKGMHSIEMKNLDDLSSGIYFIGIESQNKLQTAEKFLLIK